MNMLSAIYRVTSEDPTARIQGASCGEFLELAAKPRATPRLALRTALARRGPKRAPPWSGLVECQNNFAED